MWGLEWGSNVAARLRFVLRECMRGSTVAWGMHPAGAVPGHRLVPVKITRCRRASGHGWPVRRGGPRLAPQAAAAGHGMSRIDDIVANLRQELPGGDPHGPGKEILVN